MLRRILVLDKKDFDNCYFTINYRLLLDLPAAQQKITDAVTPITLSYANTDEITAANNKSIVEKMKSANFVYGTGTGKIKTALENDFASEQNALIQSSKWNYYGTYWDGVNWVTP